jgi:hypothetical protein
MEGFAYFETSYFQTVGSFCSREPLLFCNHFAKEELSPGPGLSHPTTLLPLFATEEPPPQ